MPNFIRNMNQDITYWKPTTADVFGKKSFEMPKLFKGRWEDRNEMVFDKTGQEVMCKTRIFVCEDVDLDGYIFLGECYEPDPLVTQGAFEIRQIAKMPDLRNMRTLTTVYL